MHLSGLQGTHWPHLVHDRGRRRKDPLHRVHGQHHKIMEYRHWPYSEGQLLIMTPIKTAPMLDSNSIQGLSWQGACVSAYEQYLFIEDS